MRTLDELNEASAGAFGAALAGVFEHSPWVVARAAGRRPFATLAELHAALVAVVREAEAPDQLGLLRAHPELGAERLLELTAESAAEQAGLGLASSADVAGLNAAYRERFGFPFIVAAARHTKENVVRELRRRLEGGEAERAVALGEVAHIALLRLLARVEGPGAPVVAGHLSTHALDVAAGRPAAGLGVVLLQEGRMVAEAATDADGRAAGLLPAGPLRQGRYELRFAAGTYFAGRETLYDVIPVAFRIDQSAARYHVPLLLAPFGYSTYRGS